MKELDVIIFQQISSNAWPAMNVIFLNGWVLRVGDGYTRRANSVLPLYYHGENLEDDIIAVEKLYHKYNLPTIFQIPDYCAPTNLKEELLSQGYEEVDESILMAQSISKIKLNESNNPYHYDIQSILSEEWFSNFGRISKRSPENSLKNQNIVKRIPFDKAFAFARNNNEIIGLGLGVLERHYLGIYDMIVSSDFRRQGIGQAILTQLITWGKEKGALEVYLQVQGDNSGAITLYEKIGLVDKYHYRYLIKK